VLNIVNQFTYPIQCGLNCKFCESSLYTAASGSIHQPLSKIA